MGEVISLQQARRARYRRRLALAEHAVMHPALRWVTGEGDSVAHRRTPAGATACGVQGPLLLAAAGTGRCADCYPGARREPA
ncbi:hypothetical protein AB0395_21620 [Streptosporangium sp. NPDC051023]|uniref:hypothetical protein n=1 Tax=Streptosporangium sp. NPDC051023 TaxID=3155410 RepID=UPI00344B9443